MASIQQSLNQTLASTQFAAGLYAHTPAGQKAAKVQEASIAQKTYTKKALIEHEGELTPANYEHLGELEERKFELTGKEKYFNKAMNYYGKQVEAAESLKRRALEKINQDEGLKERLSILEGGRNDGE